VQRQPVHAYNVPAVVERRIRLSTGDPNVGVADYVTGRYLGSDLRGVSLGCGFGRKEALWVGTGAFAKLTGYDLSATRVEGARARYPHPALEYVAADAYKLDLEPESLDIVIFEDSLHHLAPVATILERCHRWLRPGGHVVLNEYVGPRKFQSTDRQLEAADEILAMLPEGLRISYAHGTVRRRVQRPSLLRMRLLDPSEAVESDRILPTVHGLFDVLEERKLGGTLVGLVLDDIAHHFIQGADEWLQLMFDVEDELLASGDIESDYALVVAQRR
jgi:SAM-dependent methyltransferase